MENDESGDFLKVIVPEGMVVALNTDDSSDVLWQHKVQLFLYNSNQPYSNSWTMYFDTQRALFILYNSLIYLYTTNCLFIYSWVF